MIPGRDADHPGLALGRRERPDSVECATGLERARPLKELRFEVAAGPEAPRGERRRSVDSAANDVRSAAHIVGSDARCGHRAIVDEGILASPGRSRHTRTVDVAPTTGPSRIVPDAAPPAHPVRLALTDTLERSRLTVFFRFLLTIPHLIWLLLWSVFAVAAPVRRLARSARDRPGAAALHRFLAAWVRYAIHVMAFLSLVGGPFPGFVGAAGSYPVDLAIDPPPAAEARDTVPRRLRDPGAAARGAYSWWSGSRAARLVGGLRHRAHAGGPAQHRRRRASLLGSDGCLPRSSSPIAIRPRLRGTRADLGSRTVRRPPSSLVAAVAAWLLCASLLLRTVVPAGLHLPPVDVDAVFGKALVRKTVHVERFFLAMWVLSQIALFATLWLYARRGQRFARESAAGPIGTGMLLGMLGLGHRLARPAALHPARRLVGPAVRPDRGGLPRLGARALARARRRVRRRSVSRSSS